MLRKILLATGLSAFLVTPGLAQTSAAQLATPPSDAKVWTISNNDGAQKHGTISLWTDAGGTHWSRFSMNLRGFKTEVDQQMRFAPDGTLQSLIVRGSTPSGDAGETYKVRNGGYDWKSQVDHGTGKSRADLAYVSFSGTFDSLVFIIDALLKSPTHSIDLLPSGTGKIEPLTTLDIDKEGVKKHLTCYAVTGFGLSPQPVWMDGDQLFAFVPGLLPAGWEKFDSQLSKAQDDALGKRAPALLAAIAKTPPGPVAFKNVKLYDADARTFRNDETLIVEDGHIADVGPADEVKIPTNAHVIDGKGKTLIPGLWDNHQHYGDDSTGPLLLASGITSVRDPGNLPVNSTARRKRIEAGQLLGPRIVPSLLIDGPGPLAAQVGVVARSLDEALADVRRAKAEGYFAIKIYGSADPAWVKPMAALAHQLGLHVHGHIPHGMRPLDAVRDGYDEITHIYFVSMQAMPDEVVKLSNTDARIAGTAKYAADIDLHSKPMTEFLDTLASRHVAVDPTLVVAEAQLVPDPGSFTPAVAPYADTLPSQFARGYLQTAMATRPDITRARMRASFAKLVELVGELNKRHVRILAGTDGNGFEVIHELELYEQAGLSPEEALATATINPATEFKVSNITGSLAKGKLAELALIDGDPQKNMGDLRQVELVMRDGKMMDAQALRASLGISGPPKK